MPAAARSPLLGCRLIQKRWARWPKEYSRKKWILGPPQLPSDIVSWMEDEELAKQERIDEQRTDILPPPPSFRGTSFIPVTYLPNIRDDWAALDEEIVPKPKKKRRQQQEEDEEEGGMRQVNECIAYYRACGRRGVVPSKKVGPKLSIQAYEYLILQCAKDRNLARAKWAHAHVLSHGRGKNRVCNHHLMVMYANCGCLRGAKEVFDEIATKNAHSWTIIIGVYAFYGNRHLEALRMFRTMLLDHEDAADRSCISCVLAICTELGPSGLTEGRKVHAMVSDLPDFVRSAEVGKSLLLMYASAGRVEEARDAFLSIDEKDFFSYSSMITGFAQNGATSQALECLAAMEVEGMAPDLVILLWILEALRSEEYLELGRGVHERMIRTLADSLDVAADVAVVNMYARCGGVEDARVAFEEMPIKDVVAWSSMVAAYAQNGHFPEAVATFREMQLEGCRANSIAFTSLVDACCNLGDVKVGRKLREWIAETGVHTPELQNALITLFGKHGSLDEVVQAFEASVTKDTKSWNAMFSAFLGRGLFEKALELLRRMFWAGEKLDRNTILSYLEACSQLGDLRMARHVHSLVLETVSLATDVPIANAVISMYAKCGGFDQAREVLEIIKDRGLVFCNAMVYALSKEGRGKEAFHLLRQMELEGLKPDKVTFINLLDSCESFNDVVMVHSRVAHLAEMATSLIDLYGKCGHPVEGKQVFQRMRAKHAAAWTAMLGAFVDNGDGYSALELGREMDLEGEQPTSASLVHLLEACKLLGDLENGKLVHEKIAWSFENLDIILLETALFGMYARCGDLEQAKAAFEGMSSRPLLTWNAMISAYVSRGYAADAIELCKKMDLEGVKPDNVSFTSLLDACGSLRDPVQGERMLGRLADSGLVRDGFLGTMASNMLAKCGQLEKSRSTFDETLKKSEVSWSVMVGAYARSGHTDEAMKLLVKMEHEGMIPSAETFTGLASACTRAGLDSKPYDHTIEPESIYRNSKVDLAGWLNEAQKLIQRFQQAMDDPVAWSTLLSKTQSCSGSVAAW